jgi:hypothetical protein
MSLVGDVYCHHKIIELFGRKEGKGSITVKWNGMGTYSPICTHTTTTTATKSAPFQYDPILYAQPRPAICGMCRGNPFWQSKQQLGSL